MNGLMLAGEDNVSLITHTPLFGKGNRQLLKAAALILNKFVWKSGISWQCKCKGRIRSSDGTGNEQSFEIASGPIVHLGTEKHWHGAAPDSFMMHIAINTAETCWMEEVEDEEYGRGFG